MLAKRMISAHVSEYRGVEVSRYRGGRTSAVIASDPIRVGARRSQPHETATVASLPGIASSAAGFRPPRNDRLLILDLIWNMEHGTLIPEPVSARLCKGLTNWRVENSL